MRPFVLGADGGREVVHLAVDVLGAGEVLVSLDLGLGHVVTVDGGRDSDLYNRVKELKNYSPGLKDLIDEGQHQLVLHPEVDDPGLPLGGRGPSQLVAMK